MKKKVLILGSTGSIGNNALEVLFFNERVQKEFELVGLACNTSVDIISKQAEKYLVQNIAILDSNKKTTIQSECRVFVGDSSFFELIEKTQPHIIVNAVSGIAGLKYSKYAVENSIDLALANKESLIMGGEFLTELAKIKKCKLLPVDSEHSAIYQLSNGKSHDSIEKIIITGSGGPFLNKEFSTFEFITPIEALKHPTWSMGKKITIDSATLINKGLEVIEAHYLFGLSKEKIKVLIHPESIVHGMVEMKDGSLFAQLATPDMKGPIAYSILGEVRLEGLMRSVDLEVIGSLNFLKPDLKKFPLLQLAYEVIGSPSKTISMNVGNELSVYAFLEGKIKFIDIYKLTLNCVNRFENENINSFDDVFSLVEEVQTYFGKACL